MMIWFLVCSIKMSLVPFAKDTRMFESLVVYYLRQCGFPGFVRPYSYALPMSESAKCQDCGC